MKIAVRKMQKKDLGIVSELAMLANPHAIKEDYGRLIVDELRENPDLSIVATDKEVVVGYALADIHGDEAVLQDIAVAEKYQMKGIGKRLLDHEVKSLGRKKVEAVLAEVHYRCASAIPFYYKQGFRITGFVRDRFGIGHDAVILKRTLRP